MSIVTVQELRDILGITDSSKDVILSHSITNSEALIEGYIGGPLIPPDDPQKYSWVKTSCSYPDVLTLPVYPLVEMISLKKDGQLVSDTEYVVDMILGQILFRNNHGGFCFCNTAGPIAKFEAEFKSGWDPLPADLRSVLVNSALAVFNLGGTFASASTGGTGALKSMTMFDAMSMSFDVGEASSTSAGSPLALIESWKMVLDKYRMLSMGVA